MSTTITIPTELVREEISVSEAPEPELDARIESAVNEVRKQRRA